MVRYLGRVMNYGSNIFFYVKPVIIFKPRIICVIFIETHKKDKSLAYLRFLVVIHHVEVVLQKLHPDHEHLSASGI